MASTWRRRSRSATAKRITIERVEGALDGPAGRFLCWRALPGFGMARKATRWRGTCPWPRGQGYTPPMATQGKGPARTFLLVLLVASLVMLALIIRPFAGAVFLAAVLAVTFHPWYERLLSRLRGRRPLAAGIITLALVLALVLPVGALGWIGAREAADSFDYLHQVLAEEGVEGLIKQVPPPIQGWVDTIWQQTPTQDRNADFIYDLERKAARSIPGLVTNVGQALGQTLLMVAALFFLLMDGQRLIEWIDV